LHPAPSDFEGCITQTSFINGSSVSVDVQWERHDAEPFMSQIFEVLGTGAGRCPFFNPDKRNVREQELVDYYHGQTSIYDGLDGPTIVWHGVDDETVNGGSPQDVLIAVAALQE
jgi:hypothetical protein